MSTKIFPWKTLLWVTIFAVAMGFLETSVVVYLRALLYPAGFAFPLAQMKQSLAVTELFREAATLIMMISVGVIAGRNGATKFAWFLYIFALWDIFYYVFLKLLLNWPEALMTWDILFLIPVTWVGPVISPVIVSLTMVLLAVLVVRFDAKREKVRLNYKEWILLIVGSVFLIVAFTWDYSSFILEHYRFADIWTVPTDDMLKLAMQYIPRMFNWFMFCLGELIILGGIFLFWKRNRQNAN